MSSRTPEECIELALAADAAEGTRLDAIRELKTANECDELEELVRNANLDERYRRVALESVATSQCESTLRELVDADCLEEPLRGEAESLLASVDDE